MNICCIGQAGGENTNSTRYATTIANEVPRHRPSIYNCSTNVVWILLDDVGFGASSTFGGLIQSPTFDSLAQNGLRYTNFHTTAICAPTRSALLTGRNSSSVHEAGFSHTILSA